jgi:hypothetical protein
MCLTTQKSFFPNVASICELLHSYSSKVRPIITPLLREALDIPHFGKYKYAIMIREEKLLEWGSDMNLVVDGVQATGNIRKLIIFLRVLTHEFLHVVEREKNIRIFTNNEETDADIATETAQKIMNEGWVRKNINLFSN